MTADERARRALAMIADGAAELVAAGPDLETIGAGSRVYFIHDPTGYVKIGVAMSPRDRMGVLQLANPRELSLLTHLPGGELEERNMHELFDDEHERGEWFRYSERMRVLLAPLVEAYARWTAAHPRRRWGGVSKRGDRWRARYRSCGQTVSLGVFATEAEARDAIRAHEDGLVTSGHAVDTADTTSDA